MTDTRLLYSDELVAQMVEHAADALELAPDDKGRVLLVANNLRAIAADLARPRALPEVKA